MRSLTFALIGLAVLSFGSTALAGPTNLVADGSFEAPTIAPGSFSYGTPDPGAWTFTGSAGVANGAGPFTSVPAPDGKQYAILQKSANYTGVISESVSLTAGVTYTLSFSDLNRANSGTSSFNITIGGLTIATGDTPLSSSSYGAELYTFTATTSGANTLAFTANGPTGLDTTSLIDNVVLTAVPEPTSFVLMGLGLVVVGGVARARRNRTV